MSFRVIGIGEVLWDLLPGGKRLGGAPANFAYHARALGADARIVSRVGDDAQGQEILRRLQELQVPADGIEVDPEAPTGTVSVELGPQGQPTFTIHENVAWDRLEGDACRPLVTTADAVCFGTLAQRGERSRRAIRCLLSSTRATALRILDVNLRRPYFSRSLVEESLALANVLKLNDGELEWLATEFNFTGSDRAQLEKLAATHELKVIALTRGQRGSVLYANGVFSEHSGLTTDIADTIGAGDAFTATLTLGLLSKWPLNEINALANAVAAYVCSCSGATPPLPERWINLFHQPNTTKAT